MEMTKRLNPPQAVATVSYLVLGGNFAAPHALLPMERRCEVDLAGGMALLDAMLEVVHKALQSGTGKKDLLEIWADIGRFWLARAALVAALDPTSLGALCNVVLGGS